MPGGFFSSPDRRWDLVHPKAIKQFDLLRARLRLAFTEGATPVLFEVFETYRHPDRQLMVKNDGRSQVGPWGSPHQYGLAVDFVPKINGVWRWDAPFVPQTAWETLREEAHRCGLRNDFDWDRAHVEHPLWDRVKAALY